VCVLDETHFRLIALTKILTETWGKSGKIECVSVRAFGETHFIN